MFTDCQIAEMKRRAEDLSYRLNEFAAVVGSAGRNVGKSTSTERIAYQPLSALEEHTDGQPHLSAVVDDLLLRAVFEPSGRSDKVYMSEVQAKGIFGDAVIDALPEPDDCPFGEATEADKVQFEIYRKLDADEVGHRILNRHRLTHMFPDIGTPCMEFTGWKDGDGYRKIRVRGRGEYVHRYVYALFNGPLRKGQEVGHTCLNRACFRPDHLKQETRLSNMREMNIRKKKKERTTK